MKLHLGELYPIPINTATCQLLDQITPTTPYVLDLGEKGRYFLLDGEGLGCIYSQLRSQLSVIELVYLSLQRMEE